MRLDDRIKDSWRKGWNCAMKLIMITILSEGLRVFIMVNLVAKLSGELAKVVDLSGSGHLMLIAKILPVDGIARMFESWFSVARVGSELGCSMEFSMEF